MASPMKPTALRFYPYEAAGGSCASCASVQRVTPAKWWEETLDVLLCDTCAAALYSTSSAPVSLLEQYQQVMLAAADLIVRHTSDCATCTRLLPLLTLRTASMTVAECVAKSDAVAWAVRDRLVSLNALAELAEVHLRDGKR